MLDERLKDLLGEKIKQVRLDCVRRIISNDRHQHQRLHEKETASLMADGCGVVAVEH